MTRARVEYLGAFTVALLLRAIYLQGAWQGNELIDFAIVALADLSELSAEFE